jgi:hypothetical protein
VTVEEPETTEDEAPDLMAALRASIDAHGTTKRATWRSPRRGSSRRGGTRARSGR